MFKKTIMTLSTFSEMISSQKVSYVIMSCTLCHVHYVMLYCGLTLYLLPCRSTYKACALRVDKPYMYNVLSNGYQSYIYRP